MNIGDLKKLIKDLDDDLPIYLQSDEEGNLYFKCRGLHYSCVFLEDDFISDVIPLGLIDDYICDMMDFDCPEDVEAYTNNIIKNNKCIVLYP